MKWVIGMDINDCIFDFAYMAAMGDAVQMRAFSFTDKEIEENKNKKGKDKLTKFDLVLKSETGKKNKETVKEFVDGVLFDNKNFDEGFKSTVITVCKNFDEEIGENRFTQGNAQKLINMTFKYLYLACYCEEETKKRFANCHCPMDRIMLSKVLDADRHGKKIIAKTKSEFTEAWSQKNDIFNENSTYSIFQKAVRELAKNEGISPVEYDFIHWQD